MKYNFEVESAERFLKEIEKETVICVFSFGFFTENKENKRFEGIKDEKGRYISASSGAIDAFGHKQLCGVGKTLENVLNLFYKNRKLLVILITKNGSDTDMPLGIISVSDIMDINSIMENY